MIIENNLDYGKNNGKSSKKNGKIYTDNDMIIEISDSENKLLENGKDKEIISIDSDETNLNEIQNKREDFIKKLDKDECNYNNEIEKLLNKCESLANYLISNYKNQNKKNCKKNRKRNMNDENYEDMDDDNLVRLEYQPTILKNGLLKDYQLVGVNWLVNLYQLGINGILADEMGLGKTIQTIAFIAYLKEYKKIKKPFLIICPKSTTGNWELEFKKWLPCANVVKLLADKENRENIFNNYIFKNNYDVIITTYEGINICINQLKKINWKYVVIDEAHKMKNDLSKFSKNMRIFKGKMKLLLTGTPIQNNLRELWSLMNYIMPDLFNNVKIFENWQNQTQNSNWGEENLKFINHLHKILKPFILKRTKNDCSLNLPPKKEVYLYCGLTDIQLKIYKEMLINKKSNSEDKSTFNNILMQLRKCCNHPYLFDKIEPEGAPMYGDHLINVSGKMLILDKLLDKLKGKHQVLIFSQMTNLLNILEDYLNYRNYKYCRIDGNSSIEVRDKNIEDFKSPNSDKFIFLLSTRAGGLGINLYTADTVILYDSDWNPQVDLQAMDRVHRIGQKNNVNVYRFITENTIEEKIVERQTIKLKWDRFIILNKKKINLNQSKALNKEDLKDLIQFGADKIFKSDKGTYTDENIEDILKRGEEILKEKNEKIDQKLKEDLLDLNINSINIYQFNDIDYQKEKEKDKMTYELAIEKEIMNKQIIKKNRRTININNNSNYQEEKKIKKKIKLAEFKFFENSDKLADLLELDDLSKDEEIEKERLLYSGFNNWNKVDFYNFIRANEKYGRYEYYLISNAMKKNLEEIKRYSSVFYIRYNEIPDGKKYIESIEKFKLNRENQKKNQIIIENKIDNIQNYFDIEFESVCYNKYKSKLYTLIQDKFILFQCIKFGLTNISEIRSEIMKDLTFKFDFFFKTRTESEINKRIQSLVRLINYENEYKNNKISKNIIKDNDNFNNINDDIIENENEIHTNFLNNFSISNIKDDIKDNIKDNLKDNVKDNLKDNLKDDLNVNLKDDLKDHIIDINESNCLNKIYSKKIKKENGKINQQLKIDSFWNKKI